LTNGKDELVFDLFVDSENQQRMVIGIKGSNIREMIDRFKLSYAKMYGKETVPIVSVKIKSQSKKKFVGSELTIVENEKK
jgi:GTPase Era involved in 16S rRNA processing